MRNGNIVTYRNSINNGNSDRDNGNDNGRDSYGVNKGDGAKIIYIQDESDILINHVTTIL